MNWIRFHKNLDSVGRHAKKFEDKYELLRIVELLTDSEYNNGNKRFFQYVDMDEMKLVGQTDDKKLDFAIRQYIEENYRRIITPLLQIKSENGKSKYTTDSALKLEFSRIKNLYTN
jgi:hypothetical protein